MIIRSFSNLNPRVDLSSIEPKRINPNPKFLGICRTRRRRRLLQERGRGSGEPPAVDDDGLGDRRNVFRRRFAGDVEAAKTLQPFLKFHIW